MGGIPRFGDLDTDLIRKILEQKGGTASPGDSKNILYRKLNQAMGARPFPGDDTNKLLSRLVQAVGAGPVSGDTDAILLRKLIVIGNQSITLTPGVGGGGDPEIVVTLNDPLWIGYWLAIWISNTPPGVDAVGSDFQLQSVFEITHVPFSFTVVFPVPPFSPAQVCAMITTGVSQQEALNADLDSMAEDHRQGCFNYPDSFGTPPDPPVAIAATDIIDVSFTANWNASADATSYRLDVSTDIAFGSFVAGFNDLDVGNVTTFSVGGLSASTTYHYRVRAVNDTGSSANSNVISLATLAFNPNFPSTIPNLLAWWRADSFSLADGTAIGGAGNEWIDQSGNANHLTQGTAANRPVFKVNIVNGQPVIRFDGINDFLSMTSELTLGGAWTWLVVLSKSTVGGGQISIGGSANGNGFEHNFVNSKGCRVISAAGASNNAVFSAAETVWKCANAIGDVGGDTLVYENKTQRNPALAVVQIPTVNVIGQRSGGSFLDGDIAEILIYSANLTLAQRDSLIDDFLQLKYALVL